MKRFLILIFILSSCSYSKPLDIPGFDKTVFSGDRGACKNQRSTMREILFKNKDMILGISENEVFKALGRYDYQGLGRKNEKSWVYFFEKGPQCENIQNTTSSEAMILQFNSIGLVKEVVFNKGGLASEMP